MCACAGLQQQIEQRAAAADLLYNHCHHDWREQLPRITLPTLFIGGKASLVPTGCVTWNASQVAGSMASVVERDVICRPLGLLRRALRDGLPRRQPARSQAMRRASVALRT
jgi:hypothetical protein